MHKSSAHSTEGSLITSDRVEGTKVLDRSGKDIGTIKRLKIDKITGRVAYAVAEFGGFLGMGGHEYTIPWRTLDYDPEKHGFSTGLSKEQLQDAPSKSHRSTPYRASAGGVGTGTRPDRDADVDTADENWGREQDRELYDYYAVAYYWED